MSDALLAIIKVFWYNVCALKLFYLQNYFETELIILSKIKIFSLGGLDENGKNMYVMEIDKDIFIFDCGLKYASGNMLGID